MKQPRQPKSDNPRIAIESTLTKEKIIKLSEQTGETMKEIIIRLVDEEYERFIKGGLL